MPSNNAPSILWFRNDLRLSDNPALTAALAAGGPVVPVFIWAPEEEAPWEPGAASRWWLHHSLARLDESLRNKGSRLVIRRGPTLDALREVLRETGATRVLWNRRYEPALIARDTTIKEALKQYARSAESFSAALFNEPWTVRNKSGFPFKVFTPFWRACLAEVNPASPTPAPDRLPAPSRWPRSEPLASLELLPRIPWDTGFKSAWTPGEAGAQAAWERFESKAVLAYGDQRDRPDVLGTSRLSPHLHFGEIGPRQVWHGARRAAERAGVAAAAWRGWQFLTELGWREFAYHLLYHFPQITDRPLREEFDRFPWQTDEKAWTAWKRGCTGYPLVDAGLRELWTTGWMHNRVRMVVGSFLVKNLRQSWTAGARWFWDTLVDADLASNTLGWQWVAGCGADAAPYFRIFNPVSQGLKFDPEGAYVRRWVPELARLSAPDLHAPWEASPLTLRAAGVTLGRDYPRPIVDHATTRTAALAAFASLKSPGPRNGSA